MNNLNQINFNVSDEKESFNSLLLFCSECEELIVKGLAVKVLIGAELYNELEVCISEISSKLCELIERKSIHQRIQQQRTTQVCLSNKYQTLFYGTSTEVSFAMARYEKLIKQRLAGLYSSTYTNNKLGTLEKLNVKCSATLFELLLNKADVGQPQDITELELSASFRWVMSHYKVGLRQLNQLVIPYYLRLNKLISKYKRENYNKWDKLELLTTCRALWANQSDKPENMNEALELVEEHLSKLQQELDEKDRWFLENKANIEQERLYAELFE